jgi:hypothetical protein
MNLSRDCIRRRPKIASSILPERETGGLGRLERSKPNRLGRVEDLSTNPITRPIARELLGRINFDRDISGTLYQPNIKHFSRMTVFDADKARTLIDAAGTCFVVGDSLRENELLVFIPSTAPRIDLRALSVARRELLYTVHHARSVLVMQVKRKATHGGPCKRRIRCKGKYWVLRQSASTRSAVRQVWSNEHSQIQGMRQHRRCGKKIETLIRDAT